MLSRLLAYDRAAEMELVVERLLCIEQYEMCATKDLTSIQAILSKHAYIMQSTAERQQCVQDTVFIDSPSQHRPSPVP